MSTFDQLIEFLAKLDEAKIHYTLCHSRDECVMVEVTVPGERWEIEFFPNGQLEIEVFRSNGQIESEEALERLFREFSD